MEEKAAAADPAENGDDRSVSVENGDDGREPRTTDHVVCPYCAVACVPQPSNGIFVIHRCSNRGCSYFAKLPLPDFRKRLDRSRARDESQAGFGARA
jgi:hypothetical protein